MPPLPHARAAFIHYKKIVGLVLIPLVMLSSVAWMALGVKLLASVGHGAAAAWALAFPLVLVAATNWLGMMGNQRLRRQLESRLPQGQGGDFVGVNQPDNNTLQAQLMQPRLETDDNVGLLRVEGDRLLICTEEETLRLRASDVERVELQRRALYWMLRCIRLEYRDDQGQRRAMILVGRDTNTVMGEKQATQALYSKLSQWLSGQVDQADALEEAFARLLEEQPHLAQQPEVVSQR